jgi:hypothetical protein
MENHPKEIIEYPHNYEEIVARKLEQLEKDYTITVKANFNEEELREDSDSSIDEDGKESESGEKQPSEKIENHYYQSLNECCEDDNEIETLNEEFIEVDEEVNFESFEFVKDKENTVPFKEPIQNPDKIKEAMRKIKLLPPSWARK